MISIFLWEVFMVPPFKPNLLFQPNTGFLSNRLEDLKNTSNVDILFLGSSKAYRGFDTRIYSKNDYKSFNLGSSAQKHIQTNYFLKEYLSQLHPKLLIYEVYPDTFVEEGIESAINVISAAPNINSNLIELVWDMNNIKTFNTFLIKLTRNTLKLKREIFYANEIDKYLQGGYVEHSTSFDTIVYFPAEKWVPNEKQIEKFDENLLMLKKYNIPYILLLTPYTKKYKNLEEIEMFFQERGEFINFNKILKFTVKEDFYDGQHLNQNAVNKLNSELLKILNSRTL